MFGKFIDRIEKELVDVSNFAALELFARDGKRTLRNYVKRVRHTTAFEINRQHELVLEELLFGHGVVRMEDSIEWVVNAKKIPQPVFDLVVVENPQGIYGEKGYVEHFDFVDSLPQFFGESTFVFFCVNTDPFDPRVGGRKVCLDRYGMTGFSVDEWYRRRVEFYGSNRFSLVFVEKFYETLFDSNGFNGKLCMSEANPSDVEGKPDFMYSMLIRYQPAGVYQR